MMCNCEYRQLGVTRLLDHSMFYEVCMKHDEIAAVSMEDALMYWGASALDAADISCASVDRLFGRTGSRRWRRVEYREYRLSTAWKIKRGIVLDLDEWTCRKCNCAAATQVHHLSYRSVFHEPLRDLISLCEDCHSRCHRAY